MVERTQVSTCKRLLKGVPTSVRGNGNEARAHAPGSTMTETYKTEPGVRAAL